MKPGPYPLLAAMLVVGSWGFYTARPETGRFLAGTQHPSVAVQGFISLPAATGRQQVLPVRIRPAANTTTTSISAKLLPSATTSAARST